MIPIGCRCQIEDSGGSGSGEGPNFSQARSNAEGGELGACHAVELPFVFDTLASCTGADGLAGDAPPQELADRVHRLWVDFMSGRALPWAAYDSESRNVRMLARDVTETEKEMLAARHVLRTRHSSERSR